MATNIDLVKQRELVDALCQQYNEALQGEKPAREVKAIDEKLNEAINEYTAEARNRCFSMCKATDDPLLTAVKVLSFKTIGPKDDKPDGATIPVRSIIEKEKQIDLLKLHKFCGSTTGKDHNWPYMIERFNFLLTARCAKELGVSPDNLKAINDSYAMSEIAQDSIRFMTQSKDGVAKPMKDPVSNGSILETLNQIIYAMIGEDYKAKNQDVRFLIKAQTSKNRKALALKCADHRRMRGYIAETCHRIVMDKVYEVLCPIKK